MLKNISFIFINLLIYSYCYKKIYSLEERNSYLESKNMYLESRLQKIDHNIELMREDIKEMDNQINTFIESNYLI
jgi:hypothetical protein